jgi:glutathione S-transferase
VADGERGQLIRIWRTPFSTNVERISLALGHKGLEAETIDVDQEDRSEVVRVSGQELVPVADFDGEIVADSPAILRRLEELYPDPPLWPAEPSHRAGVDIFIDWFNRVWKLAPNAIAAELERAEPDEARIEELSAELRYGLGLFEGLLSGSNYLLGPSFTAGDCVAFPFLKYAAMREPDDDELFHRVLEDYQPLGEDHPNLTAWIARVDGHPRAF